MKQIDALRNDIDLLNTKIDNYYMKYGELPILCEYTTDRTSNLKNKADFQDFLYKHAEDRGATLNNNINANDGDEYGVIDLEKLGGFTLNFGYDANGEYFQLKQHPDILYTETIEDEVYVINLTSHQIYFPHGLFIDNVMYYTSEPSKFVATIDKSTDLRASDVKSKDAQFYSTLYGSVVTNYTSENGYNTWKVFYADDNHFYLIASDYIEYTTDLKGKAGNSFLQGDTTYNYKFGTNASDGVMQDYPNGTAEIQNTNFATAKEIKELNSKYFSTFPGKRAENNKKALASMLDTAVWKGYMDKEDLTGKAQYAIGGPTIEMLFNSYNQKKNLFNEQGKGQYQVHVPSEENIGYGYKISTNYGEEESWGSYIANSSDYLDTTDTVYIYQSSNTNASGYWLASPSVANTYNVMGVSYSGCVDAPSYNLANYAFRPIVCLKSDVVLTKVGTDQYKIAN